MQDAFTEARSLGKQYGCLDRRLFLGPVRVWSLAQQTELCRSTCEAEGREAEHV